MSHPAKGQPCPPSHPVDLTEDLVASYHRARDVLQDLKCNLEERLADHPQVSIYARLAVLDAITALCNNVVDVHKAKCARLEASSPLFAPPVRSKAAPEPEPDLARLPVLTDVVQ